jgi:DNA-3-methyladenine glycosylase II
MWRRVSIGSLAVPRVTHDAAARTLAGRDPVLRRLVKLAGPPRLRTRNPDGRYGALVRAIVYQQLAGSAAAAIHGRVRALVKGTLTPEAVAALPDDALRAAGLSGAKLAAIRDLTDKVLDGTVPLLRLGRLDDDEVVTRLSEVRGVGRWTAEMFLLFELRRLDVWPTGDLGVRAGYQLAWGLPDMPTPKELDVLGDPYRPYRSVAAWYCWEAVHLDRGGIDVKAPHRR